jgi:disulfide bond formation protein DsbB
VPQNASIEQLRESLTHQAIVRCDKPAWTLFGISMAGYNFATALALAFGVIQLLRKKHGP